MDLPTTWPAAFAFAIDRIPQIIIAIGTAYGVVTVQRMKSLAEEATVTNREIKATGEKVLVQTDGRLDKLEKMLEAMTEQRDIALTENRGLRGEKNIEKYIEP